MGKYFAAISIVALTLTLTAATYIPSVQALALDNVTLDYGSILGAYLGLMLLGMTFSAVGLFTSILVRSQVVAFLLSSTINAMGYLGFELISEKKQFAGYWDFVINGMGFKAHYESISLGLLDFADVAYFLAIIVTFLSLAILIIHGGQISRNYEKGAKTLVIFADRVGLYSFGWPLCFFRVIQFVWILPQTTVLP